MATFEDFIKDFDLTDGTRITASRISDSQKNGKNNISGVVSFYFEEQALVRFENTIGGRHKVCYSEPDCKFSYTPNKSNKSQGHLVIYGKNANGKFQVDLTDFSKPINA